MVAKVLAIVIRFDELVPCKKDVPLPTCNPNEVPPPLPLPYICVVMLLVFGVIVNEVALCVSWVFSPPPREENIFTGCWKLFT